MRGRAPVAQWVAIGVVVVSCQGCSSRIVNVSNEPVPRSTISEGRLRILHPYLAERLRHLEERSLRFRAAMDSVRGGQLDVLVGTPELLASAAPVLGLQMAPRVGEFAVLVDSASGRLQTLIVRIDLERLAQLPRRRISNILSWFSEQRRRATMDRLVDAVLIHEIWGHLLPVASAGSMAARCADPQPGDAEAESCVMRRENELRRDLNLPERRHYAVDAR